MRSISRLSSDIQFSAFRTVVELNFFLVGVLVVLVFFLISFFEDETIISFAEVTLISPSYARGFISALSGIFPHMRSLPRPICPDVSSSPKSFLDSEPFRPSKVGTSNVGTGGLQLASRLCFRRRRPLI